MVLAVRLVGQSGFFLYDSAVGEHNSKYPASWATEELSVVTSAGWIFWSAQPSLLFYLK